MLIEIAEQKIIHYLCTPYIVETSYRGRFIMVLDANTEVEIDDYYIADKVLRKHRLFNRVRGI